jgi:hypothetical protein
LTATPGGSPALRIAQCLARRRTLPFRCNFARATVFLRHRRGEHIMSRLQKTAAAAAALVITLVGSVLVTAPIALADPMPVAALQHSWHSSHHAVRDWAKVKSLVANRK